VTPFTYDISVTHSSELVPLVSMLFLIISYFQLVAGGVRQIAKYYGV